MKCINVNHNNDKNNTQYNPLNSAFRSLHSTTLSKNLSFLLFERVIINNASYLSENSLCVLFVTKIVYIKDAEQSINEI